MKPGYTSFPLVNSHVISTLSILITVASAIMVILLILAKNYLTNFPVTNMRFGI
jgi:hypothetical protein